MKRYKYLTLFVLILYFFTTQSVQAQTFGGKWRTKRSLVTGKPTITINIVERKEVLGGTIVLVNPDRTQVVLQILNPNRSGRTLRFQTEDRGDVYDWCLILKKGGNSGRLTGSDRRSGKFGPGGETLIEADVTRRGP